MTQSREEQLYRIVSSADLPMRMKGVFTHQEAYRLACEWNSRNDAVNMAVLEKVDADLARSPDAGPPFAHSWED